MQTRIHIRSKHYFTFEGLDNSERILLTWRVFSLLFMGCNKRKSLKVSIMFINRWSDNIVSPENHPVYIGNLSDEVWTTEDKRQLRVGDMSDAHVINCYKLVCKTSSVYWQNVFRKELLKRGI